MMWTDDWYGDHDEDAPFFAVSRQGTTEEDVLHALRGTSQRLDYGELLDALRKQNAPVAGVTVLLEQMMRAGRVRCTDRGNNPWFWGYKDEDFDDGPMYVEEA